LFFKHIFTGDYNFKGVTARRLYKSFGVKGLKKIPCSAYRMCLCVSVCIAKQRALTDWLLGAFRKLRKMAISSSCRSVNPSARNNSAPTARIFTEVDIWEFFENLTRKFKCGQSLTRTTSTPRKDIPYFPVDNARVIYKSKGQNS
jgi:hypothetical protein